MHPHAIDLRAGGHGQEFLIAGWSHPEAEYTWTLGQRSLVRLPAAEPARDPGCDWALKLRAGPMLRPGVVAFQRLHVTVNGTTIARLVCRAPSQYELHVPAAALRGHPAVDIVFELPDAQPPGDLAGGGDRRELGVWLSSLHFAPLEAPAPPPAGSAAADRAMLMALHSLGANCELGFVQRAGGAEPLGLFRWANTPLPNLLGALDARFAGLGAPDSLAIELDGASEFQVVDRRFGFRNHSFAFQTQGARREDVLRRELVRLPYLARLLVEELEAAEKLFCFHDAGRSGPEAVARLAEALGRYGPNWLLWVRVAETAAQIGAAEPAGERLIVGYIDRFQPLGHVENPSLAAWMGALRAAHGLWQAGRATA